ncbi:MAG: hypothetical protein CMQ43_14785 [Gammaproteobacteria bacterium]|nr:hypothetical protein [Gammaproteobacteria bacterium]
MSTPQRPIQILALAALVAAAAAAAQPAEPAAARTTEPEADPATRPAPGDLAPTRPVAPARAAAGARDAAAAPSATDPVQDCFQAAAELAAQPARPRDERAAYTCDLAVQVARDLTDSAGRPDRAALAATLANRSLVLAAAGKYAPALADLDEALTLAPQNAALHGNRGNLLLRLNRPVDALDAHDQAIALAPRDPAGYINRGFSHRALGNAVAAAEDVERARVLGASAAVRQPGNGAADAGRDR